jgi:hypothetical protein
VALLEDLIMVGQHKQETFLLLVIFAVLVVVEDLVHLLEETADLAAVVLVKVEQFIFMDCIESRRNI